VCHPEMYVLCYEQLTFSDIPVATKTLTEFLMPGFGAQFLGHRGDQKLTVVLFGDHMLSFQ
jgi:hypothetical protein